MGFLVFPAVPFLPIWRPAGYLLGAMLMVVFQVISPTQAYSSIDLSILGLLFGTMMVSVYLEKAEAFKYLEKLLTWKSQGPKDLVFRVCLVSAIASAFFTNDTTCMVLTEFALKIARKHDVPPRPFLLALASSANIGSSATPIGNPQNLAIALNGFNKTGIPSSLWEFMEPYSQIDHATGIAILALTILILSNVISNVPTVLLLGGRMAASAACISPDYVNKAWLMLAWVSTVSGNLSLVGSAANMIVCEQARRLPHHYEYNLSFWSHLKFGVPSIIIVTAIGLILLNFCL
ncbi:hypothetical protein JCGZ_26082 [Jatropha curcas]|uniref:Citrate transporter-like domain-containing protein n=1 Tax=Jatropha curcas TaxID=180498 RepID=A0A067JEG9_JATCU|nr:hypothetical protein JCGZ_26082 [Jatropha curcas]